MLLVPPPAVSPPAAVAAIDHASLTLALWDPIQGTRDTTQALFNDIRAPALTLLFSGLLYVAIGSWQAGAELRALAATAAARDERTVGQAELVLLLICLGIDLGGDASFILPGVGEAEDVLWAPVSALLVRRVFASNLLAIVDFAKEALPFTDVLPLATLAWVLYYVLPESSAARALGLGVAEPASRSDASDAPSGGETERRRPR
jgi:hypothetical protein